MASEYQLGWRTEHSTIVINNILYTWGGNQKDLPQVHDNEEKRKITHSIDLFHLPTFTWERRSTTGTPPVGVRIYACTKIDNKIFYYGGNCKPGDCHHNNLYELNSLTNNWREVVNCTPDNVPMKKIYCGMISFKINRKYNLLVFGGFGPVPITTTHSHSQYSPPNNPNRCYTNEVHMMCVTTSPGQWIVPVITGTRPPPCAGFTMYTLHNNQGVMFGGSTIDETGIHRVDDLYIFSCTHNTIDFQKVVKSTVNWPEKRSLHASTVINTISNKVVTSHLMISGGWDDYGNTLNDFWIIQLSSFMCYKLNLPVAVIKRYHHSMTTYEISNGHVWLIVTGGCSGYDLSANTAIPVTGSDVTYIMELVYSDDEWILTRIWNSEQNWFKTEEVIKREKEVKWSIDMREKDMKLTLLQSSESSLKFTVATLNKQLQESQKLLEIQKTISLAKSQELEDSKKRIILLKKTLTHLSTISSDEKTIEDYQKPQETELVEEKQSKPVDEDKSVISDKTLIALEENESLQKIVISKNEQVEELQSMLEMKEAMLGSIQEQTEELQSMLEIERDQTKQLKVEMEEFKKIEELRISSSHYSEVIKYQRDAAVQFSYMIPVTDHLDGVHVAGETLFLIQGDKPQSLNWEEYGFRLHFPQGTISPSNTCEVVVKALVGGKFQFPEGTELVSAVYAVAFGKKLLKAVEMEIQHCVNLTNEEQGKYLSFVSTAKTHRHDPNKFEFVEGGVFYPGKRYASIQRMHYCKNAIVEDTTPPPEHNNSSGDDDSVKAKLRMNDKRCYTGQVYYERKGYNTWLMKFIVVRDIDAFVKYISTKYPKFEEDQTIRFTFLDPVDGYVELVLENRDQVISQGWSIEPHVEPLRLMKRDIDLYGSHDIKLPPSCLLSVWTESSNPKRRFSHPLPLSGIDSNTRKIYIHRYLETSSTSEITSLEPEQQIRNIKHEDGATPNTDTDRSHIDTNQMIKCIELVMEKNHAKLCRLFKTGSLKTLADELLEAGIITRDVQTNPTSDTIINCFLSGFVFKDEVEEIEEYCVKFFNAFYEIRGPYVDAANKIKKSIQDTIIDKLGVQLNI